ncbi:hypothetical protein [Mongoliitalea daihaiensis]|uniref:hypothetical protein n=1 Tax=Mongoliitalea daihaiensis TaxID=2782006 RepID=UPI001F4818B3|nr:hypothetical protein [Mongoliitalea daihaiensis]UJP66577.1 hypothetical protein IPZ59_08285 [Mongoliitalea daihaiensis]
MKRIAVIYLMSILFAACSLSEDSNPVAESEINSSIELRDLLISAGNVRIIRFIEDGRDKTALFSTYRFSFNTDGTVVASLNGNSIQGTYRVFRDDGRLELEMDFPDNSPLDELNDDWYFISRTANTLTFEDSGDSIVFEW